MKITRQYCPKAEINLLTNAILLPDMGKEFYDRKKNFHDMTFFMIPFLCGRTTSENVENAPYMAISRRRAMLTILARTSSSRTFMTRATAFL